MSQEKKRKEKKRREEKSGLKFGALSSPNWRTIYLVGFLGAAFLVGTDAAAVARFGTYCQKSFQNNDQGVPWQSSLDDAYDLCGRFVNELNDTDTSVFYWTLEGQKTYIEDTYDEYAADDVNLMFILTHGSTTSTDARWCMWDKNTRAYSSAMRLGDENYGESILASWACNTHNNYDDLLITRWRNIFRGGLRITVGSHNTPPIGNTTDECGKEFADNLQKGDTIRTAWHDALSEPFVDVDAAVIATGETSSECETRRNNMKWQNYTDYRRLRDGQVVWYCWSFWDNL